MPDHAILGRRRDGFFGLPPVHDDGDEDDPAIALLVVAASRLYRESLIRVFGDTEDCSVVATAAEPEEARQVAAARRPDAALIDVPPAWAAPLVREITRASPRTKVIALGVVETESRLMPLIEAGAAGYVTTDGSLEDMLETVRRAARGEGMCSPRMVAALLRRIHVLSAQQQDQSVATLTAREMQVVALIDDGLSNKQIAQHLSIEVTTVKNHVHNILDKLGVTRRTEAADKIRWRLAQRIG
jgi:two-component system, NarL family, nitrate/nitrite response regulator NarL